LAEPLKRRNFFELVDLGLGFALEKQLCGHRTRRDSVDSYVAPAQFIGKDVN